MSQAAVLYGESVLRTRVIGGVSAAAAVTKRTSLISGGTLVRTSQNRRYIITAAAVVLVVVVVVVRGDGGGGSARHSRSTYLSGARVRASVRLCKDVVDGGAHFPDRVRSAMVNEPPSTHAAFFAAAPASGRDRREPHRLRHSLAGRYTRTLLPRMRKRRHDETKIATKKKISIPENYYEKNGGGTCNKPPGKCKPTMTVTERSSD